MLNFKRRSRQLNQLIFSDSFMDNIKIQNSVTKRYNLNEEVNYYKLIAQSGFLPKEEICLKLATQGFKKNSQILCIGGGCGREPFAFEKQGFKVTSLDNSLKMTTIALEIKRQIKSKTEFYHGNFLNWDSNRTFSIIFLSSVLINFIQGSKHRIHAFKKILSLLKPGGMFFFETDLIPPHPLSHYNLSSMILKLRFRGGWEKGDTVRSFFGNHSKHQELIFYHHYSGSKDVYRELKEADFLKVNNDQEFFWSFKK